MDPVALSNAIAAVVEECIPEERIVYRLSGRRFVDRLFEGKDISPSNTAAAFGFALPNASQALLFVTLLQVPFKTLSLGIEAHKAFGQTEHKDLQTALLVDKGVR
jgi:hypothetical protein